MTIEEIISNSRHPGAIIDDLKKKTVAVPDWSKLEKEYDPSKHPVITDPNYTDKIKKGATEKVTRITLGWMKLAVKRMTELLFGIEVQRIYNDHGNEQEKKAAAILEAVYTRNRINSVNVERGRWLFAACEAVTLWYTQEQPTSYAGEPSRYKIRCRNYSPFSDLAKRSERIYPLYDEFDDLIALSIEYTRMEDNAPVTYFETYTKDTHVRWRNIVGEPAEVLRETYEIDKIPAVYIRRTEPIWEDQARNVFEVEWSLSRNGNYIRKNSRPTWVVASDDDIEIGNESNNDNEGRNVLHYPADAKFGYATWPQAIDSLKFQIEEIRREFFMQLQLPDMSMDSMKATPMSGEARKMLFIDAQMKARDESGAWLEFFSRETNVLKALLKKAYPGLAAAFDALEVEHRITPYQIRDDNEKFSNLSLATNGKPFMSQRTAVKEAGYVDDVDAELAQLAAEAAVDITEPSF